MNLTDQDVFFNLLESVELAFAQSLTRNGRDLRTFRRVVGWSQPPQDQCPEISVWGDNLRAIVQTSQYSGSELSKATCANQWSWDVTIRVSECFVDVDDNGNALDPETLTKFSKEMYRLMHNSIMGFWCRWVNGELEGVDSVATPQRLSPVTTFGEGGCGGVEVTITVLLG